MYLALRKFLTFQREKRNQKVLAAKRLYTNLYNSASILRAANKSTCADLPASGLTRTELIEGMTDLGLQVSDEVARDLLESIDIDHSDSVDGYEFEAWMQNDVSRAKVRL